MISRRRVLVGLIAAPAIVRASSIMPVSAWVEPFDFAGQQWTAGQMRDAIERARTGLPRIKPIIRGGKPYYLAYAEPVVTL